MILRDLEQNDIEATVIKVENDGEVKLIHCSSDQQIANIMTKALLKRKFEVLRAKLAWNTIIVEDVHWVISKFGFDDYIEPLPLYLPRYPEDGGGERGSLIDESLLKRPMVDAASGCNITPYHLPHNFPMAHHHFVYPPPMGNGDIQRGASNGSTSQCVMDSDVESPMEDGNE
ncbi:hypothetical protein KY290_024434 [Solanum tuberosum]|uniref:Uncharacterized protein n=1 Tax=Solanum tuberosum TaxID=4113 RepID=A0ABQ7USH6_SOLTU|nr:hypothetical protein KY290_024434 [Solanum tuberosum]